MKSSANCALVAMLCALALWLPGSGVSAGEKVAATAPVAVETYSPHFLQGKNLAERWEYRIWFPNGYLLNYTATVSNEGPGDGTGLSLAVLLSPDGSRTLIKNSRKREEWQDKTSAEGPHLVIVKNELKVALPNHRIHAETEQGAIALNLVSRAEPIQPGRFDLSESAWFQLTLIAPRLAAEGTLQLPGEPAIRLENGVGVALHTLSNVPANQGAVSVFRFDTFDGETQVSLFEITTPKSLGYRRKGLVVALGGDDLILQSSAFEREFTDVAADPDLKRYRIPGGFKLSQEASGQGLRIDSGLDLRTGGRLEMLELLNSGFLRAVMKKVSRPVNYQLTGDYEIRLDTAGAAQGAKGSVITGKGLGSLDLTDSPPDNF